MATRASTAAIDNGWKMIHYNGCCPSYNGRQLATAEFSYAPHSIIGCLWFTELCSIGKLSNLFYETDEPPNPRPTQPKEILG